MQSVSGSRRGRDFAAIAEPPSMALTACSVEI
jgi:hypothetical protein